MSQSKQRQDSALSQLQFVIDLANQHGCYDAADWIRDRLSEATARPYKSVAKPSRNSFYLRNEAGGKSF